ncbi:MAG TPA: S49 family peptidase [Stellaceae bacterium]|nr:S49 family peptidase [Stellaceae bacterium]
MLLENLKHWINDHLSATPTPVVGVLRLEGVIGTRGIRGLSLDKLASTIERAFRLRNLKAVALAINSPGGSAVQSALIYRRIRQLAAEKKVPVFAFAEDVAASGGYWLLLAGDEIYADAASLVGSIGVVTAGFGLAGVLKRVGVERRLHTAGRDKSLLDPFLGEDPRDIERLTKLQQDLHETFKELVTERRGAKLAAGAPEIFEGEIFTGRRAAELGLVDRLGDLRGAMRERFGDTVRLRVVEPARTRRWAMLPGLARSRPGLGDLLEELWAAVEERLIWSRFGL